MVDWKNVKLPLPDIIKYTLALLTVGGPLIGLCIQVGAYKDKVDELIQMRKDDSLQLYEQRQDINEIKMVLQIRQAAAPESYNLPESTPLAKEHAPLMPQVADMPSTFVRR